MKEEMQSTKTIPDFCNEFILDYCSEKSHHAWMPKRAELIERTEHMCSWLFKRGLTDRKLVSTRN